MRALLLLGLGVTMAMGCSNLEPKADDSKDITTEKKVVKAWPTDVTIYRNAEGKVICPVMKDEIASPDRTVGFQDYKGVRYYFCCAMCPEKFKAKPEEYIAKK